MRSVIHSAARSIAFRRTDWIPCFSHHFRNRSSPKKNRGANPGLVGQAVSPAFHNSFKVNPAGAGLHGLDECTIESETAIARVQDDIWYRKSKGSNAISGGIVGHASRG